MAFPPPKKPAGGPPTGPPDPFGSGPPPPGPAGPPGMDPFGPAPAGGPAMPPGMDPFGGAAQPGLAMNPNVKPGQGMDPMSAMLGGLGDPSAGQGPPQSQGPPLGPDGFPVGGSMGDPGQDGCDPDMGGSDLLKALAGSMGGGMAGDPYSQPPGAPDTMFQGIGQGDPNMGQEQLLQMLALAQMGVGGGPGAGSSGVPLGPQSPMGQMVGM